MYRYIIRYLYHSIKGSFLRERLRIHLRPLPLPPPPFFVHPVLFPSRFTSLFCFFVKSVGKSSPRLSSSPAPCGRGQGGSRRRGRRGRGLVRLFVVLLAHSEEGDDRPGSEDQGLRHHRRRREQRQEQDVAPLHQISSATAPVYLPSSRPERFLRLRPAKGGPLLQHQHQQPRPSGAQNQEGPCAKGSPARLATGDPEEEQELRAGTAGEAAEAQDGHDGPGGRRPNLIVGQARKVISHIRHAQRADSQITNPTSCLTDFFFWKLVCDFCSSAFSSKSPLLLPLHFAPPVFFLGDLSLTLLTLRTLRPGCQIDPQFPGESLSCRRRRCTNKTGAAYCERGKTETAIIVISRFLFAHEPSFIKKFFFF